MVTNKDNELSQQEFLRQAAKLLKLSQQKLAARMGTPWVTFRKWLSLSGDDSNERKMPAVAWQLVREILDHEKLKRKLEKMTAPPKE